MRPLCCHMTSSICALLVEVMTRRLPFPSNTGSLFTTAIYREVLKRRDSGLNFSNRFNRHLGSSVTEMPVEFQSDTIITTSNLAASRVHETCYRLMNRGPNVLKIGTSEATFSETFYPKSAFWKMLSAIFGQIVSRQCANAHRLGTSMLNIVELIWLWSTLAWKSADHSTKMIENQDISVESDCLCEQLFKYIISVKHIQYVNAICFYFYIIFTSL